MTKFIKFLCFLRLFRVHSLDGDPRCDGKSLKSIIKQS